jgi:hypothetical protein
MKEALEGFQDSDGLIMQAITTIGLRIGSSVRTTYAANSSNNAIACFRSSVSKPSVNQL